jgi:hypothetical protein
MGQDSRPLLRDGDPLLPDAFNPPRSLVFVTRDDRAFDRFLGRVRPVVVAPNVTKPAPQGVEVIDGADADRDGYVEYYDGGAYVAELKRQQPDRKATAIRFTGTIGEVHTTNFEGATEPHLLLRILHTDGKNALVDVGPADALAKLNMRRGDTIGVLAQMGTINGRPALIADEVTHESTTVKIVRGRSIR